MKTMRQVYIPKVGCRVDQRNRLNAAGGHESSAKVTAWACSFNPALAPVHAILVSAKSHMSHPKLNRRDLKSSCGWSKVFVEHR